MSKPTPSSITVEEAVARMVNMDYIPEGFTLLDMTSAFLEDAEVEYENALADHSPADQLAILKIRMESCVARHSLAQSLLDALRQELNDPENSMVVLSEDTSSKQRVTLESVSDWAADRFGIGVPEWMHAVYLAKGGEELDQNARWEDVTIKIYADYRIGYSFGNGKYKQSSFRDIDLMGERKLQPNFLGGILIGLSLGKKFPKGTKAEKKDRTAISKLRDALVKLTGISSDPFIRFNATDGWKPKFTLIDDRDNADKRTEKETPHVEYDEERASDNVNNSDAISYNNWAAENARE